MAGSLLVRLALGAGIATLLAYIATPVAIAAARRFEFYDRPAGYKGHVDPTPYLGGAAVMIAFALAVVIGAGSPGRTLPLLGGVAILLVVGTIDDRRNLSPTLRAGVELSMGMLLSIAGLGWKLGAGPLVDAAATGTWIVAVVNSFNLFDNMDGAAGTMAAVVSGGACILAASSGATWAAAGSAALCGACLGFLPHNLAKPAKIFLGDGGSMPLGFAAAILVAAAAGSAETSTLSLLVGFLLVGVPALDTALVIVSRRRRGISILTGGQDHLTHRTRLRVRTAFRVVLVLGSAQALVSGLVIVAVHGTATTVTYVLLAFVVVAAATIGALVSLEPAALPSAATESAEPDRRSTVALPTDDRNAGRAFDLSSLGLLGVLGLGIGLAPLFSAYYSTGVWVPIGLGVVIVAAACTVARPPQLTRPAQIALGGVAAIGLWTLLSATWSPSVEQATLDANRWLVYGAIVMLAMVLIRSRRDASVLLGAAGAGLALLAVIVLIRMLGPGGPGMFVGGRLNLPLGYINGQGCVFAMGAWLALGLAERRNPLAAGLGAGAAVLAASLALMSESRGAALATVAALVVTVAAIPGRRRRLLALATIGLALAAAGPSLIQVYTSAGALGTPRAHDIHVAVAAVAIAAVVAAVVWAALVAIERRVALAGAQSTLVAGSRRLATVLAVAVVALPCAVAVVKAGSIERSVRNQWHAFIHLADASGANSQTRLLSGAGNRYDYWRVAWHLFTAQPVAGAGDGGYAVAYYRHRATTEAIENPHSIELALLSELGIVGIAFFAALLAAAGLGIRRLAATAGAHDGRTLAVGAAGLVIVWLVDASGDWMDLLPGITALALLGIVVLTQTPTSAASAMPDPVKRTGVSVARVALAALVGFVLALTGASLMRTGLAQIYLSNARADLSSSPRAALTNANRALRLDGANLDSYYVKAAALARFDDAAASKAVLLQAAHQQPTAFVTWTLLGDLEVRLGRIDQAREYYRRAQQLDPRDPALGALVADPRSALQSSS